MNNISICLTPELIHKYELKGTIVVVVDILRATSCMTTAMAYGVKEILPLAEVEACKKLKDKGYVIAGERDGKKIENFDIGNSPYSYMNETLTDKCVAITTTNGTYAIEKSKKADEVIVGSFLNLSAVVAYLEKKDKDVLIVCAGWKGNINLEDTLYAGALVEKLKNNFEPLCDSCKVAQTIYNSSKDDMLSYLEGSSHVRRLQKLNIQKDIEFCLKVDMYDVVPVLKGDCLTSVSVKEGELDMAM